MTERLTITRTIAAPREAVWQKWTTEAGMRSWWWRHWQTDIALDFRVGGAWRTAAPEQGIDVHGVYTAIDEPSRLAFTWFWDDADGKGDEELVVVTFADAASGGTALTIEHSGGFDASGAENYRQGWEFVLAELEKVVAES